jgi:glycosyltransferase involved in cell wall biosynthesis
VIFVGYWSKMPKKHSVAGRLAAFIGKLLDWPGGLPKNLLFQVPLARVSLAWVGGFPAHYMGEFHCRLQALHPGVFFLYLPLSRHGQAFAHEMTNLPAHHVRAGSRWQWLWCWRCLERLDPQAVLIAGNYPRANLVAAAWALSRGRPLYYLADSNPLDRRNLERNWLNSLILRMVLRRVERILSIGMRNTEFYMRYLDKEDLGEALLAFPLPHLHHRFETVSPTAKDVFVFLVFGRLDDVKAVDKVISAYALLDQQSQKRSRLLIAGDGKSRSKLESQVEALGLGERVEFLGSIPSDQAPRIFGEAHALVLASRDEPWGLVVNEALSAGIPVIGPFWVGSFADLVLHGQTGLVTQDNTPAQLAAAMQALLADPARAAAMGQAGRVRVREQGWTIDGSLLAIGELPELKDANR